MYALAAELALTFESAQVHTVAVHLSGTLNYECDALSRLTKGEAKVPAMLDKVERARPRPRQLAFSWAWPPALLERASAVDPITTGQGASRKRGAPSRH